MLSLKIHQLKCFKEINIPIADLTVMAGANGVGKSTSIQALLLLRQTIEQCTTLGSSFYHLSGNWKNTLTSLNEYFCLAIGNTGHALYRDFEDNHIDIGLAENEKSIIGINYEVDNMNPELFLLPKNIHRPETSIESAITQKEFYYLNAERVGPRIQQSLQHQLFPNAGWQGESCAQLLSTMEYEKAFEKRNVKDKKQKFFIDQVNDWLNEILGGIRVTAKSNPNTLSAQVLLENTFTSNEPTLSTNLGFGVSYLLPIIANCLIAKEGSFVIIENPEAHLHPSAQSKLGSFLAKIASSGVKVILETHSDHIISGIQIATAEKEIFPKDVCINFFNEVDDIQPLIETITISINGELSKWPKGFFDQTQLDYAHLFNLRKHV